MKVRMKTLARGPAFMADPGDVLDVPEAMGRSLVAAGSAEEVAEASQPPLVMSVEEAIAPPAAETAVEPRHSHEKPRRKR